MSIDGIDALVAFRKLLVEHLVANSESEVRTFISVKQNEHTEMVSESG